MLWLFFLLFCILVKAITFIIRVASISEFIYVFICVCVICNVTLHYFHLQNKTKNRLQKKTLICHNMILKMTLKTSLTIKDAKRLFRWWSMESSAKGSGIIIMVIPAKLLLSSSFCDYHNHEDHYFLSSSWRPFGNNARKLF